MNETTETETETNPEPTRRAELKDGINAEVAALYGDYVDQLPNEEWVVPFGDLVGRGYSPKVILAAIDYVTSEKTQREAARDNDVSSVAIRLRYREVIETGPIDEHVRAPRDHSRAATPAVENCEALVDELGWSCGIEYVREGRTMPYLLIRGWRRLIDEFDIDPDPTPETGIDYCELIADELGWEYNTEYRNGVATSVYLTARGWESLTDCVTGCDTDGDGDSDSDGDGGAANE